MSEYLMKMGKCLSWLNGKRRKNSRCVTIAIFGIDNAGKTVTVKGLQGEDLDDVAPTIGFQSAEFHFHKHNVTVYDLGGGKGIRDIWTQYYSQIYGIIYVIDASAIERIHETKQALHQLLSDKRVSGKPVLLLANKQDIDGAMDETDLCDALSLEDMVNQYRTPCRVEMCTATFTKRRKVDKSIKSGFKWLLAAIDESWGSISTRVAADSETQRKLDDEERRQRRERVRIAREERERLEGKEEEDEDCGPIGDPFKPLDLAELTAKDETLKQKKLEKKKKKKQLEESLAMESTADRPVEVRQGWLDPVTDEKHETPPAALEEEERPSSSREEAVADSGEPRMKAKKKKKRTPRGNKTAPISLDGGLELSPPPSSTWLAQTEKSKSERTTSPVMELTPGKDSNITEKWSLELPSLSGPNEDDDDVVT